MTARGEGADDAAFGARILIHTRRPGAGERQHFQTRQLFNQRRREARAFAREQNNVEIFQVANRLLFVPGGIVASYEFNLRTVLKRGPLGHLARGTLPIVYHRHANCHHCRSPRCPSPADLLLLLPKCQQSASGHTRGPRRRSRLRFGCGVRREIATGIWDLPDSDETDTPAEAEGGEAE